MGDEIIDATYDEETGRIRYITESGLVGQLTQRSAGRGTLLTDNAMEQMAEQMIGIPVEERPNHDDLHTEIAREEDRN